MIPNKPPVRRRHNNKWTDADETELANQVLEEKNNIII